MREIALDAYLARVGLGSAPAATVDGLIALHRAHRRAIPFENLDIPLGRGIGLDPDAVFAKLVTAKRGGYCFEQNALLLPVLHALGFAARALLARVWLGTTTVPPRTHTFSLATIAGQEWVADAGFGGSDAPPMPLEEGSVTAADGVTHRLRRDPDHGWMLERNGERQYSFTEERVWPADLAMANHWTATSPGSRFAATHIASILHETGLVSLTGADDLPNAAAYRAALAERFGIMLSAAEVARLGLFAD